MLSSNFNRLASNFYIAWEHQSRSCESPGYFRVAPGDFPKSLKHRRLDQIPWIGVYDSMMCLCNWVPKNPVLAHHVIWLSDGIMECVCICAYMYIYIYIYITTYTYIDIWYLNGIRWMDAYIAVQYIALHYSTFLCITSHHIALYSIRTHNHTCTRILNCTERSCKILR